MIALTTPGGRYIGAHIMNTTTKTSSFQPLRLAMRSVFLLGALAVSPLASATEPAAKPFAAIDLASQQLDVPALQQLSQQMQDDYQFAYAQYRLAVTASVRADETVLKPALSAAADRLEQLVAAEPAPTAKAEALALLALTRGMQAGYYPIKGMYYGQKSSQALAAATTLQPQNPRVTLAAAILAYQTPSLFGGDKKAALSHANAAVSAFAAPCQDICWGEAEAYVWRGLAKKEAGDLSGAKADWQQALQLAPEYGWAKQLLQGV
jgi:tetratricopeptide (TPR) repeat protein